MTYVNYTHAYIDWLHEQIEKEFAIPAYLLGRTEFYASHKQRALERTETARKALAEIIALTLENNKLYIPLSSRVITRE